MKENKTLWITRTAIFLALLVVVQYTTASLGNTLITGSLVNLILIVSVMTGGFGSGAVVAIASPVLAKLLGIGPLWELIPFIMLGNLSLVAVWYFLDKVLPIQQDFVRYAIDAVAGALVKFLVLYLTIVKIMVPFLALPEAKATVISATFSTPQLITALIGGAVAILILPPLKKALSKK